MATNRELRLARWVAKIAMSDPKSPLDWETLVSEAREQMPNWQAWKRYLEEEKENVE
jgi:hypothetical protein